MKRAAPRALLARALPDPATREQVLAAATRTHAPRWSVAHDVLGWWRRP
jgi:hypothetical protein